MGKAAKYKRNFLDSVILRLDFDSVDLRDLEKFSEEIKSIFPFREQKEETNIFVDVKKGEVDHREEKTKFWYFLNYSKNKELRISEKALIIQYNNGTYKNATELLSDCEQVVQKFSSTFKIQTINRIGLRYINRIKLDTAVSKEFSWKDYFNSALLGNISFAVKNKGKFSRAMSQICLKYDSFDLTFNYGVWNDDFPNTNTRKEFILDFDCFSRSSIDVEDNILSIIKEYNKKIEELFEKSIKDELRVIMTK